jgi:hypothetical protein
VEIFLPPDDFPGVHFLGTHDDKGVNCGVFFLRVDQWSVRLLAEVLNAPPAHTKSQSTEDKSQRVFHELLKSDRYRSAVMYQPKLWYNAYQVNATYFEGDPGDLLVHFHDIGGDKWSAMDDTLGRTLQQKEKWQVFLEETTYEREISDYWNRIRKAYKLLDAAQSRSKDPRVYDAVRRLQYATTYEQDREDKMLPALTGMQVVLGLKDG